MPSLDRIALTFFLVANPIGNCPPILALVKDYDIDTQRKIIMREAIIALFLALFFQFFGEVFLSTLNIQNYAVTLCGGILLFIVALSMIFTKSPDIQALTPKQEPFIVPIATPILTGPGLMAIIMLQSHELNDNFLITSAILIAWVGVFLVLSIAPYMQKVLGKRGMVALEQLMGMILSFISMGLLVEGVTRFLETLQKGSQ